MIEKKYTKIYFRILPMENMVWDHLKILNDHKTIYIRNLQQLKRSKEENLVPIFWSFRSDHVFFNHTQKQIYNEIVPEVLGNISKGCDAIILAYGQTGTGKSLTVNGLFNPFESRGILPRIASEVFSKLKPNASKNNTKMCVQVSYVEFSKTTINDLLKPCPNQLCSIKDFDKVIVRNVEDVFKIIFRGEGRKNYSENSTYPSHSCTSIFTFYISTKRIGMQDDSTSRGKLHIVDMAGPDTVGNFSCLFKKSQEIGAANLAKTQLEQFFLVLCSNIPEQIKIKQRINPLIQYLGDSLNKTSILRIIGHLRVSREDLLVTISMLRFGQLLSGLKFTRYEVKIDAEVSQERIDTLQKELDKLKLNNQYDSILMHQDLSRSLNQDRFAHIERTVNEYLQNKITQLTLLNVCDITIALEILKMVCQKSKEEKVVPKEESTTKIKPIRSSHSRGSAKSSRLSHKASSDHVQKKALDEKPLGRALSASSGLREVPETGPKSRSKTSASSLVRRSSLTKHKSNNSCASLRDRRKSDEVVIKPEIPPEHGDAWNSYLTERSDEYRQLVKTYEKNEAAAKNIYKTYLSELDKLNEITSAVEKHKNYLLQAKMTREFQQAYKYGSGTTTFGEFERCCMNQLADAEKNQFEKQELVLECQAELKTYINVCKDVKKDLQNSFNEFCKEKYEVPVVNLETPETARMDILQALDKEEEPVIVHDLRLDVQDEEAKMFERFKHLIEVEKRKKKIYQIRHKEWLIY